MTHDQIGRPLVNPHATAIERDKQLLAQQCWDRNNPPPHLYVRNAKGEVRVWPNG